MPITHHSENRRRNSLLTKIWSKIAELQRSMYLQDDLMGARYPTDAVTRLVAREFDHYLELLKELKEMARQL